MKETENKLKNVQRIGRLPKLMKELDDKNSRAINDFEKEVIKTWINSAYECGLKDAGDIIGKNISKEIDKEVKKVDANSREDGQ